MVLTQLPQYPLCLGIDKTVSIISPKKKNITVSIEIEFGTNSIYGRIRSVIIANEFIYLNFYLINGRLHAVH